MEIEFDVHRSLLELTGGELELPEADRHTEALLARVAAKPMRRLSAGELLVLLRLHLALEYVAPVALEKLEEEPWLKAERHAGDLLVALLESDSRFWRERHELWLEAVGMLGDAVEQVTKAVERPEDEEAPAPDVVGDDFMGALLHFRGLHQE